MYKNTQCIPTQNDLVIRKYVVSRGGRQMYYANQTDYDISYAWVAAFARGATPAEILRNVMALETS